MHGCPRKLGPLASSITRPGICPVRHRPKCANVPAVSPASISRPSIAVDGRFFHCVSRASAGDSATAAAEVPRRPTPSSRPPPELAEGRFEEMYRQLLQWREQYYTCIVPRQAFDAMELGDWVHRLRRLKSRGKIPDSLVSRLDGIGFSWRVDNITAKWYHNLHVARRYKALHGTAEIPPDHVDPEEPDFVEAARWLSRQQELYIQQKLTQLRVRLIKEALGIKLSRPYAPTRRNLHQVIRRENAQFQREFGRRAAQRGQRAEQESGREGGGAAGHRGRDVS